LEAIIVGADDRTLSNGSRENDWGTHPMMMMTAGPAAVGRGYLPGGKRRARRT
jgi:hypothetical protein